MHHIYSVCTEKILFVSPVPSLHVMASASDNKATAVSDTVLKDIAKRMCDLITEEEKEGTQANPTYSVCSRPENLPAVPVGGVGLVMTYTIPGKYRMDYLYSSSCCIRFNNIKTDAPPSDKDAPPSYEEATKKNFPLISFVIGEAITKNFCCNSLNALKGIYDLTKDGESLTFPALKYDYPGVISLK